MSSLLLFLIFIRGSVLLSNNFTWELQRVSSRMKINCVHGKIDNESNPPRRSMFNIFFCMQICSFMLLFVLVLIHSSVKNYGKIGSVKSSSIVLHNNRHRAPNKLWAEQETETPRRLSEFVASLISLHILFNLMFEHFGDFSLYEKISQSLRFQIMKCSVWKFSKLLEWHKKLNCIETFFFTLSDAHWSTSGALMLLLN